MFESIVGQQITCYKYFKDNEITNRDVLRDSLKTNPIKGLHQSFVEALFSQYQLERKEIERKHQAPKDLEKLVCINDLHIPYHDLKTVSIVFDLIVDIQPNTLILNGDIMDCYSVSEFLKKPYTDNSLQDEIDTFYQIFSYLRKYIPNTEIHYILGNHEARLEKASKKFPHTYGLKCLDPQELFRLNELDIKHHKTKYKHNGITFYHGDTARKDSGASAKAEYMAHKMIDGMSGHTHRLGSFRQSYEQDSTGWWENGCLCSLDPDYFNDPDLANWQQGFSIVNFYEGTFDVLQHEIRNHKFYYEPTGKTYK